MSHHLLARLSWPGSPTHLAVLRIVYAIHLFEVMSSPVLPLLKRVHASPHSLAGNWFPSVLETLGSEYLDVFIGLGLLGCLALLLGFRTRSAAALTLTCFLFTQNYWFRSTAFHDDWLFFTCPLLILCFARSGDVWSIDAWWAKRGGNDPVAADRTQYRWPIEFAVFWFAFVYVSAGVAKLFPLQKGLIWLTGVSTQEFCVQFMFESPIFVLFGGTPFDYAILWPFSVATVLTAVVELGVAWVWFSERGRPIVIISVIGMHVGIFMMGIPGFIQIAAVCSLALIPSRWFPDTQTPQSDGASPDEAPSP